MPWPPTSHTVRAAGRFCGRRGDPDVRRVGAFPWTGQSQARSATHGATKLGSQERQQPPAVRKGAGDSPCKRRRWAGREAAPAVCGQRRAARGARSGLSPTSPLGEHKGWPVAGAVSARPFGSPGGSRSHRHLSGPKSRGEPQPPLPAAVAPRCPPQEHRILTGPEPLAVPGAGRHV